MTDDINDLYDRDGIVLPIAQMQSTKENQNNENTPIQSVKERMKLLTARNGNLDSTNDRVKVDRRNFIRFQTQVSWFGRFYQYFFRLNPTWLDIHGLSTFPQIRNPVSNSKKDA
jgi:hypothetical protein